jgi:peroxiredoxin Q/BCP
VSSPGVGDPGPDFVLAGTGGVDYHLADYLGRSVLLVFYPQDNSPVCILQLRNYSEGLATFADVGAQVIGISPQSVASHEAFAERYDVRFPLLADTDKAVGQSYGILGPLGFYRRSVFVLDAAGIIRYVRRSMTNLAFVERGDLVQAVRASN